MKYVFVALMALLCASMCEAGTPAIRRDIPSYGLLNSIENCDIVAIGTVELLTGVWREDVTESGTDSICTDVTFRIETLIKGEANLGDTHIKFMHEDGSAYVPSAGEVLTQETSPGIKFTVGEKVMLFLKKGDDDKYHTTYAYGGRRLYKQRYGKRLVKDDYVKFRYAKNNRAKPMKMSLDLAANLAKAFMKNPEAARSLENEIKLEAKGTNKVVSSALSTRLINSAKAVKRSKQ